MDPDCGAFSGFVTGCVSETLIDFLKNAPIGIVDIEMSRKGVKDRPEAFL